MGEQLVAPIDGLCNVAAVVSPGSGPAVAAQRSCTAGRDTSPLPPGADYVMHPWGVKDCAARCPGNGSGGTPRAGSPTRTRRRSPAGPTAPTIPR